MATAALRSRRSAAQLHALAGVQREIRSSDRNGRRKYLSDFTQAFRSYESVLRPDELRAFLLQADIVLIGDYHALPTCQSFTASVVEQLASSGRPVVLALEPVLARDQQILDEWSAGEMDEDELRERLRFDVEWGYEWAPFHELLCRAREQAAAIYGLDCLPRNDLRKIGARDRHAAEKIADLRARHPEAVIVAQAGESHLAPNHLPQYLRRKFGRESMVTILQNVDALYFRAAGEPGDPVSAVRVSSDVACVFNSTPLEKYESYRLCLERWKTEDSAEPDLGPSVYNLIDGLLGFFHINRYSPDNGTQPRFLVDLLPQVYHPSPDGMIRRSLSRQGAAEKEVSALLETLETRGCAYVPSLNAICIRQFDIAHAAEEAARFLHHACHNLPARYANQGTGEEGSAEDGFFARVVENVLGYFGSCVLYPVRPLLASAGAGSGCDEAERRALEEFLRRQPEFDPAKAPGCRAGRKLPGELLPRNGNPDVLARDLGYLLGGRLYDAYLTGYIGQRYVRSLLFLKLDAAGSAREACRAMVRKLRASRPKAP